MKLLSCYVQGYGKIKEKEYAFLEGITSFCEENGEGKTTLASFIKAMFYGLKGYRKGSVEFSEREHFYPFDGGLFGGNLTFEKEGNVYKIERFFGEKSETADGVRVYKNGAPTEEFGKEIGKSVFGVDEESFSRTLFLGSGEMEIGSTSSINAYLNRFLEGGQEDGNFDGAIAALEKAAKEYKKSRAGSDKITLEREKIDKLRDSLENAKSLKAVLENKYAQAKEIEEEIARTNERIVAASKEKEKRSQFEHYESLLEGVTVAKQARAEIEKRYPRGVPAAAVAENFSALCEEEKALRLQAEGAKLSPAEEAKFVAVQKRFTNGVPSQEDLLAVEKDVSALAALRTEERLCKDYAPTQRERELREKFLRGCPTQEALEKAGKQVEEYKRLQREGGEITPTPVKGKAGGIKYKVALLIAVVLLAVGVICLFLAKEIALVALILGGGLLLGTGFAYLNAKAEFSQAYLAPAKNARLVEIEDGLKSFLLPLGYASGNGVAFDLATLFEDVRAYRQCIGEQETRENRLATLAQRQRDLEGRLTAFFAPDFPLNGEYTGLLSALREERQNFLTLNARQEEARRANEKIAEKLTLVRAEKGAIEEEYALANIPPKQLVEDAREAQRLRKAEEEGNRKAEAFRLEKGLEQSAVAFDGDLEALQETLSRLQGEASKLARAIDEDEREAERLEEYEEELEGAEARLQAYKQKYKLLTATAELLTRAEGRLRDRYVKPIKEEFLRYAALVEETLGERLVMNKDFSLRFERSGIERSEKHLSAGQKSLCALCFRLALIKNMYRETAPFLVMDDPFTALDSKHLTRARALLQALSKEWQIVYFTCHESREIL